MPCALILNELMTNALKYAFSNGRKGEIRIGFVRFDSGEMELSCQDNGVGISEDFEWAKSKSLGFRIVKIIAKQIDGIFTLDRRGRARAFTCGCLPEVIETNSQSCGFGFTLLGCELGWAYDCHNVRVMFHPVSHRYV